MTVLKPRSIYHAKRLLFVESYLVTKGTPTDQVYQLIEDAGFEVAEQTC